MAIAALAAAVIACGDDHTATCVPGNGALTTERIDVMEPVIRQSVGQRPLYIEMADTPPPCSLLRRFSPEDRVYSASLPHRVPRDRDFIFSPPEIAGDLATVT